MSNQTLIDAVRNWIHFDNLCTNLSKQMISARNLRNRYEEQVIQQMGKSKRLRISGAILEPTTKNTSITLNWTTLEETLHKYYEDTKKPDETDNLLKYLKENRGQKSTVFLKKIPIDNTVTNNII
jgi:hypothetical protein